jgi:hypothetical protein
MDKNQTRPADTAEIDLISKEIEFNRKAKLTSTHNFNPTKIDVVAENDSETSKLLDSTTVNLLCQID